MSDVTQWLYGQGVLGVVVAVLLWAVRHLYAENTKLRDRYEMKQESQNKQLAGLVGSVKEVLAPFVRKLRGGP
jgi:predicted Holliday junction resolvase-like endonuclease